MTIGVWEEAAGLELIPGMCRETQLPWQGACSFPARGIQDLGQGISGSAAASFPFKTSWLGWKIHPSSAPGHRTSPTPQARPLSPDPGDGGDREGLSPLPREHSPSRARHTRMELGRLPVPRAALWGEDKLKGVQEMNSQRPFGSSCQENLPCPGESFKSGVLRVITQSFITCLM